MEWDVIVRVAGAMGIGLMLGLERELAGKPAGLRTYMFVCGSACLLILLGDIIISRFAARETTSAITADPIRIFQAIIVGVSFIGTGTIWQREQADRVEGLTTAAMLLFAAALGMAVALDRFLLALALATIAIAVGFSLKQLEARLIAD